MFFDGEEWLPEFVGEPMTCIFGEYSRQSVPAIGDPLIGDSPVHLAVRQGGNAGKEVNHFPKIHTYALKDGQLHE